MFARAVQEDRIVVTENADDFRKLAASVELHPGLIILPSVARAEAQRLMELAVAYLLRAGGDRPYDLLVNSVLTVSANGAVHIDPLP